MGLKLKLKDSFSVLSSNHSHQCHLKKLRSSESSSLFQTPSPLLTNGQAACTPSETKPDAVPVGLSPPPKFSPTELASKVVTTSSSPHKIWSLVIDLTTVAKVVTSTKLGTTSTPLVLSLMPVTHTPPVVVPKVPADPHALDLVLGRNITPKDTLLSEMSTPSNKKSTPTVQSKLVSSSTPTS